MLILPRAQRPIINLDMVMLKRPIDKRAILSVLHQKGIQFIDGIPEDQQRTLKGI